MKAKGAMCPAFALQQQQGFSVTSQRGGVPPDA
jgi:hypothetical protein